MHFLPLALQEVKEINILNLAGEVTCGRSNVFPSGLIEDCGVLDQLWVINVCFREGGQI